MTDTSPTVRHRRLAAELRRLRERAGLTPAQAAAALGWSRPKLVEIETAKKRVPTVAEVELILSTYGGDDPLKTALVQLARDVRMRGWWAAYGDVLPESYIQLEDAAASISASQLEIVPGLLQTPDYARALIRSAISDEGEVDRRVQARLTRQTILSRENAPSLEVLLHEMALRSLIGGREVMRDQLTKLLDAAGRPHISIRVLPGPVGARPGIGSGSFTIFGFAEPMDLDVVHLDSVAGDLYVEDVSQVNRCKVVYARIGDACLSQEDSIAFIAHLKKE